MRIGKYKAEYARQVTDLFHDTIHATASADYTPEELEAWAPTPMDYEYWAQRLLAKDPFVVIDTGRILGFGELEPDGHIDCFYVHKDHQRRHIGVTLMHKIEAVALRNGDTRLHLASSITAKPFFERMGFSVVRPNLVQKGPYTLKNYVMQKKL